MCWKYKDYNLLLTYLLTHLLLTYLPPWSRVLLEKVIGIQLFLKFPALYGTRNFITAFTITCHLSLSWGCQIIQRHNPEYGHDNITHFKVGIFHKFTEKPRNNNEITVNTGKAKMTLLPENGEKGILRTSKVEHVLKHIMDTFKKCWFKVPEHWQTLLGLDAYMLQRNISTFNNMTNRLVAATLYQTTDMLHYLP